MKRAFMFIMVMAIAAMLLAGCAAPNVSVPKPVSSPTSPATSIPAEAPSTERGQTTPGSVPPPEQTNGSSTTIPVPSSQEQINGNTTIIPAPPTQESVTEPSTGIIQVLVTDAPKHDVHSVNITVSKVEVHKAGGDGTSGKWTSLNVTHEKPFNLLDLQNGLTMLLADGEVKAGKYTQLRMTIFEVIVDYDDVVQEAEVPSGELKFVHPFTLEAGGSITLIVDIDAAKSVIITGGKKQEEDKVLFKPVVKLQVISEPVESEEEADTQAPTVLDYSPPDNATGVVVSDNLTLTFDEDMVKGTGNITIMRDDDFLFEQIDVNSENVTISEAQVIINPSIDFATDTGYYVLIDATAFTDNVGNSYAGISNKDIWNFTTAVITPFTINSGTLASDNSYIDIAFSEGAYGDSGGTTPVESSNFNLIFNQNGGSATDATISSVNNTSGGALTGGESTIRVNISITGTPSGVETIEIRPHDSSIYNIAGNAAAITETTGTKTLNDQLAPMVLDYSPFDNATNVAVSDNLVLTFDDAMVKGTGNITIKKYSDNSTIEQIDVASVNVTISGEGEIVTINPSSDFVNGTGYYVLIDATAFTDDDGNSYEGIANKETWNFTTSAS